LADPKENGFDMEIFFVRHGETEWNRKELLQGTTDVPLSETGMLQAKETAKKLKGNEFDAVYVSPLQRALQTAEILLGKKGGIVIEQRLRERHFGKFEGEAMHTYNRHIENNPEFNPEQAETREEVKARVSDFFNDCIRSGKKRILVVAHGGVFSAFLMQMFGLSREKSRDYRLKNCEMCVIKVSENRMVLLKDGMEALEKNL
jgi:broad specificity phosphatase PhoE